MTQGPTVAMPYSHKINFTWLIRAKGGVNHFRTEEIRVKTGSHRPLPLDSLSGMPIRYREVLEHMQGYLAAYPLGFQADETEQQNIVADRNGYRLGESKDLALIKDKVETENKSFTATSQRKTFRQLKAMFS
jgi:hypothetical protein